MLSVRVGNCFITLNKEWPTLLNFSNLLTSQECNSKLVICQRAYFQEFRDIFHSLIHCFLPHYITKEAENPGTRSALKIGYLEENLALKTGYLEEYLALKSCYLKSIGNEKKLPGKESYQHKPIFWLACFQCKYSPGCQFSVQNTLLGSHFSVH